MNGKPWFEAALLAIGYGTLSVLSFRFGYEVAPADRPIGIFIALLVALSLVWTIAAWRAFDRPPRLGFVLITAALFRAIVLPSYPVQEDDLYRYLWDGKVVARGLDPYLVTPKAVRGFDRGKETVDVPSSSSAAGEAAMRDSGAIEDGASGDGEGRAPEPRDELEAKRNLLRAYASIRDESDTNRIILERVNHPDLVTIYPEITQLLFSIVGRVVSSSWGLFAHIIAMKALLGLFDLGIIA
ncbi:MAG TPA: hypothetical protein VK116_05995, partial [Planctomycetota bacterium]|nr:hypothetical protein [Planctomycetota bacterium]